MTSWIQSADFSSEDIPHLEGSEDFENYIDNLPKDKLDAQMLALEAAGNDFCPWGIGVNMSTDHGMHVCREDVSKQTYSVLIQMTVKRKVLGFIPLSSNNEQWEYELSHDAMKQIVAKYYGQIQKPSLL
jgi:hypothetical protein